MEDLPAKTCLELNRAVWTLIEVAVEYKESRPDFSAQVWALAERVQELIFDNATPPFALKKDRPELRLVTD